MEVGQGPNRGCRAIRKKKKKNALTLRVSAETESTHFINIPKDIK
jgi:hypothetical protein